MTWYLLPLLAAAAGGHLAIWVCAYNRLHALNLPCRTVKKLERSTIFPAVVAPALYLAWCASGGFPAAGSGWRWCQDGYLTLCIGMLVFVSLVWVWRQSRRAGWVAPLLHNDTRVVDMTEACGERPVGDWVTSMLARLPGNEILKLSVHDKTLKIPQLPPAWEGLTIAHLSDLHFTGRITPPYFEQVVAICEQWQPDLALLTGDIVDKTHCVDWIAPTLGKLQGREGQYFILGNHDQRVANVPELRSTLRSAGWEDLGGRWRTRELRGQPMLLAGNEFPWFPPRPELQSAPPPQAAGGPFRLLLTHTPDQFTWAVQHQFDLILAGHTHGGQIRLPWLGPLVCPSAFGVRYACGVFSQNNSVMHVSRGLSGVHQLRFNCPPELTRLTLVS